MELPTDYRALQFDPKMRIVFKERLPMPEKCRDNEVLIKVIFAGVCGTDVHIIEGYAPVGEHPVVLGHEITGEIQSVGHCVKLLNVGDLVAVKPNRECVCCQECVHNVMAHCSDLVSTTIGIHRDGGWAEFCFVPEELVYRLPSKVTLCQGVLCEPMACVICAWDKVMPFPHTNSILIIGASLIGRLMASILHIQGYRKVMVVDTDNEKRQQMLDMELGFLVISFEQLKHNYFENETFTIDLAIDCVGSAEYVQKIIPLLNYRGCILIFGCSSPHDRLSIKPFDIFVRELKIIGSLSSPSAFNKALQWIDALGPRYLKYPLLGIKTFHLKNFKEALMEFKQGLITKAIFDLTK